MRSFKVFAAAASMLAAFGFNSSQALGANSDLGLLVPTTTAGITQVVAPGSFMDTHSFQVASTASLEGVLSSFNIQSYGISHFMAALWTSTGTLLKKADILGAGNMTIASLGYMPLLAAPGNPDPYEIRVSGIASQKGGVYSGVMVVAPVPEPEIYAMMGIGIALMGWAGRKQRRRLAAA